MARQDIKPRVRIPKKIKKGTAFEVKTLVSHPMESGQRPDKKNPGKKIPRDIINSFTATYNGKLVMKADWKPGMSANPYAAFYVVAEESGKMDFIWVDDNGDTYAKSVKVNVVG